MVNQILDILCSSFDTIILLIYFQTFLKNRRTNIPLFLFFLGFIMAEIYIFFLPNIFIHLEENALLFVTLSSSVITTFLLTFYYNALLRHRFFVTITFQIYATLAEYIVVIFFPTAINASANSSIFVFFAKLILLIFVLITNIIFNHKNENFSLHYNLLILLIPLFSLIISIAIGLSLLNITATPYYLIIELAGILFINVINFFLFDHTLQIIELRTNKQQLEHQLSLQAEKYQQISTAYRNTRSMLHDTKKHFFFIQSLLENKEYTKAIEYLPIASEKLEQTYNLINTGNLVIDAFLSNHTIMASQENIQFNTNIQIVSDHIQIADYDLCIILGNLLDNCFQACRKIILPLERKIEIVLFTTDTAFVIHTKNTMISDLVSDSPKKNSLYHGYGLKNIESISRKYNGNFSYFCEANIFECIVTIPYIKNKSF